MHLHWKENRKVGKVLVFEISEKNISSFHKTSNIERLLEKGIRKSARVRGCRENGGRETTEIERELKRLEINVIIDRPEEFLSNELNTRRLRIRPIPVSAPVEPPRCGSVTLDRVD